MKNQVKFGKWRLMLATMLIALSFSSCKDGFIYDGEGDCNVYYNISFKYDYNMKFADAFAKEVNSVALFVFDTNNTLVKSVVVNDESVKGDNFAIPLDLPAGRYELLAWAGLKNSQSFKLLADAKVGVTKRQEMQVKMNRETVNGVAVVDKDLSSLFHGMMSLDYPSTPGTYNATMSLMKNTNSIRVMLQQMSDDLVAEKFRYEITADNGYMDWNNNILEDEVITYKPWYVVSGTADVQPDYGTNADHSNGAVSVAIAEFTLGRMIDGKSPILTIWNKEENKKVLSIPIADYALLVKGYYNREMNNQEYLDRQDDYTMTFFLDEDGKWLSASILVNSWRVVLNNNIL